MMTRITKLAVSGLTALSISLSPVPAAAADGEDIAKAIAGLAILGIIAKAASDRDDDRVSRSSPYRTIERSHSRRVIEGDIRRAGKKTPRVARNFKSLRLPGRCRLIVDTRYGSRQAYGKRCVNKRYEYASYLPRRCEVLVRDGNRNRVVYGSRCLARDGWNVARR